MDRCYNNDIPKAICELRERKIERIVNELGLIELGQYIASTLT